jgi:hypothetical protein
MIGGGGVKPHCEHFKPTPLSEWLCYWWEAAATENGVEHFCSRPDWEERVCETHGQRNRPEMSLMENVAAAPSKETEKIDANQNQFVD